MKPEAYSNRPLDFNSLTSREFEEVVYHYFNDQLRKGFYEGIYDKVELSSGVGEKGADVILFYKGKIEGVVQCKKYNKNIDNKTVLSEIIKFLLHHLNELDANTDSLSSLINDIESFTYYIAVSKDFTQNTKLLLADFNNKWQSTDIRPLIENELKYVKLDKLKIEQVHPKVEDLLNQLNVLSLKAVDLDLIIRSNVDVINRYFSTIQFSTDTYNRKSENSNDILLSNAELKKKAKEISRDINRVKTYFGNNEDLAIIRPETQEIHNWINKELKDNEANIAIVAGNAGMGKSVVISQLYNRLEKERIPVVSLKADRLTYSTSKELEDAFDLDIGFKTFLNQLIDNEQYGVLLIDQIDALSQALSSDLKPLKFYDNLIQKFIGNPRVKIIVSTRIYDLNYDPIISNYKGKRNFIIRSLDKDTLNNILNEAGIQDYNKFSDSFIDLVSVPLHLDVFLKVYTSDLHTDEIKSLQDLYSVLWRDKIIGNRSLNSIKVDYSKVSNLVFELASKMYKIQQINIDQRLFEDKFSEEIIYLRTEGIINTTDKIEFFHQSFFDYAFARNFTNENKNLTKDVLGRHQGLFIRSKIKQILNYRRSVDEPTYCKDIKELILHEDIRFHIKLLVLQQIAFQQEPLVSEKDIVNSIILPDTSLSDTFLSLFMGEGWLYFFIEEDIFRKELEKDIDVINRKIVNVFRRFIFIDNGKPLLEYYQSLKDSASKDELIIDYLWNANEFNNSLAIELIETVLKRKSNYTKEYWYYRILENAITQFPEWVKKQILSNLDIKKGTDFNDESDYFYSKNHNSQVYDALWEKHPDIGYETVKAIIKEIVDKRCFDSKGDIKSDTAYLLYDRKNNDLYKHHGQLDKLQNYLEDKYKISPDFVKTEVKEYLKSNYITEIIIGFSVIFKYTKEFKEEAYNFFLNYDKLSEVYSLNQYLNYMILEVFGRLYLLLDWNEKETLNRDVISNFHKSYELRVFKNEDGVVRRNKFYGIGKYELLTAIVDAESDLNESLYKEYQELKRKFGRIENIEPEGVIVHVNRDPLNAQYDKFTLENWKQSFKTYTIDNKKFDSWNQPTEYEHGRRFVDVVSQNPSKFINFIEEIIEDLEISNTYVVKALEGLKEGKIQTKKLIELFCKTIKTRTFEKENTLYLIWLTRYFSENEKTDDNVFSYLEQNLITGDEGRDNLKDSLSTGINSVRGAAASALVDYSFSKESFDFICSSLKTLANNSKPSTRAAAIYKMQYLLQHGMDQVMELFLELANDFHPDILKVSINPLQYLINHNFEGLIPFFQNAIKVQESSTEIGKLITIAYCRSYKGSQPLVEEFLKLNKPNTVIRTAFEFVEHETKIEEALSLIERFYDNEDKEIGEIYNRAFFQIKPSLFSQLKDFLYQYVNSKVGKYREHPFYDFLLKSCNKHPKDCIALASKFNNHHSPDITERMLRNEPLQVIISAYNAMREYYKTNETLESAMDVFDDILQNKDYRDSSAFQIIKDIDSY
ncbi:MAG: ATP-binding protein [Maribacter litoralis]|uniref:ATP-binding protein n=1 Tax=Maribacter litoralis TaxID=2059726 RepID=UPI0032995E07